jgi:hypothetical protein
MTKFNDMKKTIYDLNEKFEKDWDNKKRNRHILELQILINETKNK